MHEYQPRIGIDGADGIQGEQMVGALHHPAPAGLLVLQVLQEALVEPVGRQMAGIDPASVDRSECDTSYRSAGCGTHAR